MVNCNPETVSTDYDTVGPAVLRAADARGRARGRARRAAGGPVAGVIVQLGGQTPLGLAQRLDAAGVPIVGTSPEAIHLAEDRGAFGAVLAAAGLPAPQHGTASAYDEAKAVADEIGYPVLVRPSLRARRPRHGDRLRRRHAARRTSAGPRRSARSTRCSSTGSSTTRSRSTSTRCSTATELFLGGVMEHIEEAGIHSGDSACALPPITLGRADIDRIRESTEAIARGVGRARAAQRPVRAGRRRALRARGQPAGLAHRAVRVQGDRRRRWPRRRPGSCSAPPSRSCARRACCPPSGDGGTLPLDAPIAVKEAVLPFGRFRRAGSVDTVLGPEMKLHRRGDGHRRRLRHRVRQVAGGGVRAAADRRAGSFVVGGQPRQAVHDLPGQAAGRPRLRDPRHRGHRRGAAPQRRPCHGRAQALRRAAGRTATPDIVAADPGRRAST